MYRTLGLSPASGTRRRDYPARQRLCGSPYLQRLAVAAPAGSSPGCQLGDLLAQLNGMQRLEPGDLIRGSRAGRSRRGLVRRSRRGLGTGLPPRPGSEAAADTHALI